MYNGKHHSWEEHQDFSETSKIRRMAFMIDLLDANLLVMASDLLEVYFVTYVIRKRPFKPGDCMLSAAISTDRGKRFGPIMPIRAFLLMTQRL